jgi:hypothetical protein
MVLVVLFLDLAVRPSRTSSDAVALSISADWWHLEVSLGLAIHGNISHKRKEKERCKKIMNSQRAGEALQQTFIPLCKNRELQGKTGHEPENPMECAENDHRDKKMIRINDRRIRKIWEIESPRCPLPSIVHDHVRGKRVIASCNINYSIIFCRILSEYLWISWWWFGSTARLLWRLL